MTSTGPGRRTRVAGAVLVAALLCGGAVGCGSDDPKGASKAESGQKAAKGAAQQPQMEPVAAVRKAVAKNEKLTSVRYRMTGQSPEDGRVEGEAAMSFKPPAMSIKMRSLDDAEAAGEIRIVDEAMYMGDGKNWIKFDASAMKRAGGGRSSADALSGKTQNPVEESAGLADAKDVKRLGTETIDGVRTTHYRGTVTFAQLREDMKKQDRRTRERREKKLRSYEAMGIDRMTMDMWIGPDDRAKQLRTRAKGDKGSLDMTMTVLAYNEPVTVKAPPADQVMDLADLARESGKN